MRVLALALLVVLLAFAVAQDVLYCESHSECQKHQYCRGIHEELQSYKEKYYGICEEQFVGFCRDETDCDHPYEICAEFSEQDYGHCRKNPTLFDTTEEVQHNQRTVARVAVPFIAKFVKHVKVTPPDALADVPVPLEDFTESEHHHTESCGNHLVEKHERDHVHHEVMGDFVGMLSDQNCGAGGVCPFSAIPKCGKGICDNPKIRDSFSNTTVKKTVYLDFLVHKDSIPYFTDGSTWDKYAKILVAQSVDDLNESWKQVGFTFEARVKEYQLQDIDGNKWPAVILGYPDCQNATLKYCVQPQSILQSLIGKDWQKKGAFQILAGRFENMGLKGFANFPWLTSHGLSALNLFVIGKGKATLKHELGHAFGLYHTFRGIDEVTPCSDCFDGPKSDGDFTGDLCSDTSPIPKNWECKNPDIKQIPDKCQSSGRVSWGETPYSNIMSYGTDECRQYFTKQQIGRVRCWFSQFVYKYSN
jgi:hypothetical protein